MYTDPVTSTEYPQPVAGESSSQSGSGTDFDELLTMASTIVEELTGGSSGSSGSTEPTSSLDGLLTMAAGAVMDGGWVYDREALMTDVQHLCEQLGIQTEDHLQFIAMFPPEGADLDNERMGALIKKGGDILAGRLDAGILAEKLGISEADAQSLLTSVGNEYQMQGELLMAQADQPFDSVSTEANLLYNLENNLPDSVSMVDIAQLFFETVGNGPLLEVYGRLTSIDLAV